MLTPEKLKELFTYKNGTLIKNSTGQEFGTIINGYRSCCIREKRYYFQKLIWMYFHGFYPKDRIIHLDGNKLNNKIENLILLKDLDTKLTSKRLKSLLNYNHETGIFTWIKNRGRPDLEGESAGTISNGYVKICLDLKQYFAHHLAWFYVHSRFPKNEIDHINGNKSDNRLANLRECTKSQNGKNKPNKNPLRGIRQTPFGRWSARIKVNGKEKHLGNFSSAEEAQKAYFSAEEEYFGEFVHKIM